MNNSIVIADHHCHVIKEYFSDTEKTIEDFQKNTKLEFIISMGLDQKTSLENLELSHKVDRNFYKFGMGLHPSHVIEMGKNALKEADTIIQLITTHAQNVDYIGEIGIDFTYPDAQKYKKEQVKVFKEFCKLGKELEKPVSIHCREAWDEVIEVIDDCEFDGENFNGYLHSFTGDFDQGVFFVENGFKLGLNGIITYKKSEELRATIKELLAFYSDKHFNDLFGLETDSPYLSPEPLRGKDNTPANIEIIAEYITENIL